jgi:DNA (cytosine-5)-methyltransferase 1
MTTKAIQNTAFDVVDLFCGAGGLSHGFSLAGFQITQAIDCWKPAIDTYRANLGSHATLAQIDDETSLPPADVIVGGPPCQGFSSAGSRRKGDQRNNLVSVFARLVACHRPRVFVFENVEGFVTNEGGRFVLNLLDPLIEAGYFVHVRKVNAANYGVPQHRKRVLAIGGLGWAPTFPSPTHSAWGAPGALAFPSLPLTSTLGEALRGLPPAAAANEGECDDGLDNVYPLLNEADLERAKLLGPGQRMRDLPEEFWHNGYRRRAFRRVMDGTPTEQRGGPPAGVRRLNFDEPCKAITGGAQNEFLHPEEHRPLTVRECARVQSFADSFRFLGKRSERLQLIGNAVPPLLASTVARQLLVDLAAPQPVSVGTGRLLSFQPTCSIGMSPALERVCHTVSKRHGDGQRGLFADVII